MAPEEVSAAKLLKIKKEKKEKSSNKRKAESMEVTTSDLQASPVVSKHSKATVEAALDVAESPKSVKDEGSGTPATKKRKSSVEEIEVDITAPEPPSKKALRRLKKGKPLPPSKSGAESTPEPETKAKKPEVEKRSEHGIWIGNLPFHVSKTDLRTFFVEKSDITEEMITRLHMPGPNDKKSANKVEEKKKFRPENNKGYAYVDFISKEAVDMAVELSEELLAGRRCLIKDNKSFEGRPEKTKEESRRDGKPPNKRVFMGNLSFDVTKEGLKEHFEKCGPVADVMIATFEDSGKCKGYGWITFDELEGAQNAVRGYAMVEDEPSDAEDSESENEEAVKIITKPKMRKWWVNKIKGRPVRMEYAEDAQVRYKKRYGKDGTKGSGKPAEASGDVGQVQAHYVPVAKVVEYDRPYAHRLTGGIVESKGKKTTF